MSMHKEDTKLIGFIIVAFVLAGIGGVALAVGLIVVAGG